MDRHFLRDVQANLDDIRPTESIDYRLKEGMQLFVGHLHKRCILLTIEADSAPYHCSWIFFEKSGQVFPGLFVRDDSVQDVVQAFIVCGSWLDCVRCPSKRKGLQARYSQPISQFQEER